MQSTSVDCLECAMSWTMISESEVVWKSGAVALEALAVSVPRLTRLPLCAMAMRPLVDSTRDGLGVEQGGVAGGGVAGVADGHVAGELGEDFVGEDFGDEAHALDVVDFVPSAEAMPADSWPRCCRA